MAVNSETNSTPEYWQNVWDKGDTFFHKPENHPMLEKHLEKLTQNQPGVKIFFPFCGKEVDMAWLASLGYQIVGVEYVEDAVRQFFSEQKINYQVSKVNDFQLFSSENGRIKIYQGDFFKFNKSYDGQFEHIWDRGALGALNPELRLTYAEVMRGLLGDKFHYLIELFNYNKEFFQGPPFSVDPDEVTQHYGTISKIEIIDKQEIQSPRFPKEQADQFKTIYYYLTRK